MSLPPARGIVIGLRRPRLQQDVALKRRIHWLREHITRRRIRMQHSLQEVVVGRVRAPKGRTHGEEDYVRCGGVAGSQGVEVLLRDLACADFSRGSGLVEHKLQRDARAG